jgi:hypothetical protein
VIPEAPAVRVPLALTLLVVGYLLVRFAGSVAAEAVPAGSDTGTDLGRLPYSPFAGSGDLARAGPDLPDGRTLVVYWLLGGAMIVGGCLLAVSSLL